VHFCNEPRDKWSVTITVTVRIRLRICLWSSCSAYCDAEDCGSNHLQILRITRSELFWKWRAGLPPPTDDGKVFVRQIYAVSPHFSEFYSVRQKSAQRCHPQLMKEKKTVNINLIAYRFRKLNSQHGCDARLRTHQPCCYESTNVCTSS
jgi:hypothetical protein